jgi:hypothetical protein
MGRFLAVLVLPGLMVSTAAAQTPSDPTVAPAPELLIAQIDDSDLRDEETLTQLMGIEYSKDAWSMGSAVGLSMIPGAGWGLVYTRQKAQAVVPILLSAIGYGLGGLYVAGLFDESSEVQCRHVRVGKVGPMDGGVDRCGYAKIVFDPNEPNRIDNQDIDELDTQERPFFATAVDYSLVTVGQDFDGTNTGLVILVSTYVATTLLGAIWSGTSVAEHNDRLRKDIESTAQAPKAPAEERVPRVVAGFDGRRGFLGFALDF